MITEQTLTDKINALNSELATLKASHDAMVERRNAGEQSFQAQVVQNQSRFQQISGAIAQLNELKTSLNGIKDIIEMPPQPPPQ